MMAGNARGEKKVPGRSTPSVSIRYSRLYDAVVTVPRPIGDVLP